MTSGSTTLPRFFPNSLSKNKAEIISPLSLISGIGTTMKYAMLTNV